MVLLKWPRLFGPDACGECYIEKISRSALIKHFRSKLCRCNNGSKLHALNTYASYWRHVMLSTKAGFRRCTRYMNFWAHPRNDLPDVATQPADKVDFVVEGLQDTTRVIILEL